MTTLRLPFNTNTSIATGRIYPVSKNVFQRAPTVLARHNEYRQIHTPCLRLQPEKRQQTSLTSKRFKSNCLPLHMSCSRNQTVSQVRYTSSTALHEEPTIHNLFEPVTGTWQYIVADPSTNTAAIIDPVLDYDPVSLAITTNTADSLLEVVKANGYKIQWILETHAHADHLTAASYLQKKLTEEQGERPSIGIGKRIGQVQKLFGRRYGVPEKEYEVVFDKLFDDDEEFSIGELKAKAIHLPGHTPDHLGYKIGNNVFCGDTIFIADIGTARCDFPGGSTTHMWNSARKLLSLPSETKIWTGHDYPPSDPSDPNNKGREPVAFMTVKEHKAKNKHLKDGMTEADFLALRKERDDALGAPRLLHQSVQINIRGGKLPEANETGQRLLHTPVKLKGVEAW